MYKTYTETEVRQVSGFDQVSIRGSTCSAWLCINQGERESLTIEAPPEFLRRLRSEVKESKLTVHLVGSWLQELEDALANCLNRPHMIYRLDVRDLTSLEVQCTCIVHSSRIETPHLKVKLNGTGDFSLDWLLSETLEVRHSGSGTMKISGQVEQQDVCLNGVGSYIASGLDSKRACVRMAGAGSARVYASQALDVTLRGVGFLEYSGHPAVRKRILGSGQVLCVTNNK